MNRPRLSTARHALIAAAALLSFSTAVADQPAAAAAPAAGLSGCPSFEELRKQESERITARTLPPLAGEPSKPELRKELLAMMAQDQAARGNAAASAKANGGKPEQQLILAIFQSDQDNLMRMRELIDAKQFPDAAQVGRDGLRAAWLIAAHADRDPDLQARLLSLLEPLAAKGDIVPQDFALLSDRVRIAHGEPQLYGSQFRALAGVNHPQPIEKPEGLEQRRADQGLLSLRDYGCLLQQYHGIPVDLTPHERVIH